MKKAFGKMLLTEYIDEDPHRLELPSPEVLFLPRSYMYM